MNSNSKVFFEVGYCSFTLGAVHKRRPQSGGGRCPVRGHLADTGVLQMRTSALFGVKLRIFLNLCCVRMDKGGWASADIFGQEVSIFRNFVRPSFMDGLLGNVQISYDGFLSNFRPPLPIWRYSEVFSQPLPHMTFSTNPPPHIP